MRTEVKIGMVILLVVVGATGIFFMYNRGDSNVASVVPLNKQAASEVTPAADAQPAPKTPPSTPQRPTPRATPPREQRESRYTPPAADSDAVRALRERAAQAAERPRPEVTRPQPTPPTTPGPTSAPVVVPRREEPPTPTPEPAAETPTPGPAATPDRTPAPRATPDSGRQVATTQPSAPSADRERPTTPPPGVDVPPPRQPERTPTPPPAANRTIQTQRRQHTVARDESLWGIAQHYYGNGALWPRIKAANPGLDEKKLKIGAVLVIPPGDESTPPATRERLSGERTPAARTGQPPTRPHTYVVEINDSLTSIAERILGNGRRWREIYELNRDRIANPDILPVGTELRLPQ